ncbi:MAG: CusA/CzcA family heavy metal efflux RND transporter [Limnobacter sp.]|nr:CusA/CzcA family heavy metal efflux RND transporter [Limnobacter sp.]
MNKLIALALSQRMLTGLLTLVLLIAGLWAFKGLPIDAFPDVSGTQVKIILKAPGMTPEEVESRVTALVEQEMLGIPRQTILRSQSKYAIADITIDFEEGTDIYWARQQVGDRLNSAFGALPKNVEGGMAPITTPLGEMFMFTIEGKSSLEERRSLLDWVIRPQLRNIVGVADVNALGGFVRSFVVQPNFEALAARGLSVDDLQSAIERNNQNDGAGRITRAEESLLVRSEGRIKDVSDLTNLVLAQRQNTLIRVGDVATVAMEGLTRYGAVTQDGEAEAVEGLVLGLRGANARLLVEQVESRLKEIEKSLPEGTTIKPFYNRGNLVNRAVGTVSKALMEAIVLVLILLVIFLGNLRSALVVAVILPLSALGTFLCMRMVGLSANLMSLGGLAIAIGMLVDAAVVIVENIEARQGSGDSTKGHFLNQIYKASSEVAVPITAGILIIMIVFLPLLTLEGLEGKLFGPVALTIVFALGCSLVLSLTVIPVLCSVALKQGHHHTPKLVVWLETRFDSLLGLLMSRSKSVYISSALALVLAVFALGFVGKSFIPTLDEGDIIMQVEKLPSISLGESVAIDLKLQQAIRAAVPEVERIVARVGSDELGLDPMGLNETDTFMVLKPAEEWRFSSKSELIDAIRQAVANIPGINVGFTQPIEMRTSEMLSGVRGDLAVKIFGPDLTVLNQLAEKTVKTLEGIQGSEDVQTSQADGVEYLQVQLNPNTMGLAGLDTFGVQNMLRQMVEGVPVGEVQEGVRRSPILIRAPNAKESTLSELRLPNAQGQLVPLSSIATLSSNSGPVRIDRENASRMTVVRSNVRNRDLVGFVEEAKLKFATEVELPAGYRVTWGGQFENQQRASARLMTVVPIALGMIVLILFFTLGNLRQSVLVISNIPFAMVGGVFGLLISGEYLSVPAAVGFIALMGIAVLNGLVLLTEFNNLINEGFSIDDVVRRGTVRRLRPVLMTASIAALGLIPLLFATGPGSEIQKPLAIVVIGGLLSSTLLTLVLMPTLFKRFGVDGSVLEGLSK